MKSFYTAFLYKNDTHYGAVFPDLPGCVTVGDSLDDVAHQAAEVLSFHLEGMIDAGLDLPSPTPMDRLQSDQDSPEIARMLVGAELPSRTVRVNITLDEGLLSLIDKAAKARGSSRSGFIAEAARHEMALGRQA